MARTVGMSACRPAPAPSPRGRSGRRRRCGRRAWSRRWAGRWREVRDHGDREVWRWRPDRERTTGAEPRQGRRDRRRDRRAGRRGGRSGRAHPRPRRRLHGRDRDRRRPRRLGRAGRPPLLRQPRRPQRPRERPRRGAGLDGHGPPARPRAGARQALVGAGERSPLLDPEQVAPLRLGTRAGPRSRRPRSSLVARLATVPVDEVAADPEGAAARALALLEPRCDRLLVHFDVDVVDFTDTPLSENAGRNEGLAFDTALRALDVLLASPRWPALTITELNPDHTEEGSATPSERLVAAVARGVGRSAVSDPARRRPGGVAFESGAGRWLLAVAVAGSGMAFLDGTVVNVALPDIGARPRRQHQRAAVDPQRLPADARLADPARRLARRPLRAPARLRPRRRPLHRRLAALRGRARTSSC